MLILADTEQVVNPLAYWIINIKQKWVLIQSEMRPNLDVLVWLAFEIQFEIVLPATH